MRLLFIDSNNDLEDVLRDVRDSYIVDKACSGDEGLFMYEVNDYDAVVIDYSNCQFESIQACKEVRNYTDEVPLLVLTGKDIQTKVNLLNAGADVCLSKPIDPEILSANIRALLRRSFLSRASDVINVKGVVLDLHLRELRYKEEIINLRRKEYELLEYLFLNRGKIVSKEQILEHVWDRGMDVFSNTVEVHIRHLRDKIEKPNNLCIIKTIRGFGYKVEK